MDRNRPYGSCDFFIFHNLDYICSSSNLFHYVSYHSFTGNKLNCGVSYQHLCTSDNANQGYISFPNPTSPQATGRKLIFLYLAGSSHRSKVGLIVGTVIGLILLLLLGSLLFFWCKGYKREVFEDVPGV